MIAIVAALVAPAIAIQPLHAQSPVEGCGSAAAARAHDADCYLRDAALVRRPSGNAADTTVPDTVHPTEPIVDTNAISATGAKDDQVDADRHLSNQLTIIGWIACVLLFARGVEFALSSSFKMEQEGEPDRLRPAASVAAIGICMAAVIFFVLLTLEARHAGTAPKAYGSLSECLHDAQTVDQIRECGTGDYSAN